MYLPGENCNVHDRSTVILFSDPGSCFSLRDLKKAVLWNSSSPFSAVDIIIDTEKSLENLLDFVHIKEKFVS